ncbi:MAG: hypothetical protein PUD92_07425 [Clostridiales bacterium]|nr:hypothetical protein [Clostridiales bacterium]
MTRNSAVPDNSISRTDTDVKEKFSLKRGGADDKNSNIYDYTKSFEEQIDDWKQGKIPKYDTLLVGETPEVLKKIGFNALPVTINQTHIDYAVNNTRDADHSLVESVLKQLPDKIKNPIAVISSKTHPDTSVVVLLDFQHNGKTVVAPVEIDGYGRQNNIIIDSNAITSIFGKGNAVTKQLNDAITEHLNGGIGVYYIDTKKAAALLQKAGLQLPGVLFRNNGYIHSITDPGSNVKPQLKNITYAQQFKRWFGEWEKSPNTASKVVNDDGTPKVMYHGTNEMFNIFDRSQSKKKVMLNKLGPGNYFTANAAEAKRYNKGNGRVISAYLDIKKPFITSNNNASFTEEVASRLNTPVNNRSEISEILKSHGYDGIILHDANGIVDVAVTFPSGQIKSATDNIGTFDGSNPDIRFSLKKNPPTESDIRRAQNREDIKEYGISVNKLVKDLFDETGIQKNRRNEAAEESVRNALSLLKDGNEKAAFDELSDTFKDLYKNSVQYSDRDVEFMKAVRASSMDLSADVSDLRPEELKTLRTVTKSVTKGRAGTRKGADVEIMELKKQFPEYFPESGDSPAKQIYDAYVKVRECSECRAKQRIEGNYGSGQNNRGIQRRSGSRERNPCRKKSRRHKKIRRRP